MNYRYFFLALVNVLFLSATIQAQTSAACGSFRTQTQGGWGTTAAGNNPGTYRDAHFDAAFPDGIHIGCDYFITFSSSLAVEEFLPQGGTPAALNQNYADPNSAITVLAGQVLALTLSVGFDKADPDFSGSDIPLADLIINRGDLEGYSISEALQLANEILGACPSSLSPSAINDVISAINQNFVDGTSDNGYLDCPEVEPILCSIQLDGIQTTCIDDGLYRLDISVSGSSSAYSVHAPSAVSGHGDILCLDSSFTTKMIHLTFEQGSDYAFQLTQIDNPECGPLSSNTCDISLQSGISPECCALEIVCPAHETTYLDCFDEIPVADVSDVEILSSCGTVHITIEESQSGNGCSNDPLILERIYTVTNGLEQLNCNTTYHIVDSEVPVIECPVDEIISCTSGNIFPDEWAVATDNCDDQLTIFYADLPSSSCSGFERLWTARDDCNNTATCVQNILLSDETAPNLTVPRDRTIDCLSNTNPGFTGQAQASDVCSEVALEYSDVSNEVNPCTREIHRTWTATDACGNSTQATQLITIADLIGPVISNLPPGTTLQCDQVPPPDAPIAIDACSGDTVAVHLDEVIQENGCRTMIRRTYTAIDNCGNASSRLRIIVIDDTEAPSISCPEDLYLNCGDTLLPPSPEEYPEAEDNCSGTSVTITYTDSEIDYSACPPVIQRLWSVEDECENVSNCSQQIYFQDTDLPTIECPEDVSMTCDSGQSLDPIYTGTAVAEDLCSEVTLTYTDGVFTGDCPMTMIRVWSAADACNNLATCSQSITVIDTVAPVLNCAQDITVSCAYANADPSVTGSPSVDGECADTDLDYQDGPLAGECPKTFTRTWTATDMCGNSSSCTQVISLEDYMTPVVFCPVDTAVACTSDLSPTIMGQATAIDYCSSVEVEYNDVEVSDGCNQSVLRSWTAIDACGNSQVCIQTIEMLPTAQSTIICPEDITVDSLAQAVPAITGQPEVQGSCASSEVTYIDIITYEAGDSISTECGSLRTQTQGGWGTTAHGGNPGTYRDAHFNDAFPNGLTIGCDNTLTLISSLAVEEYLPCGGTPAVLNASLIDPSCINNTLSSQLTALSLSVGFDNNDPDFGLSDVSLGDMMISNGPFVNWTVYEILEEANRVFGSCESEYSVSQMNQVLSSINENYVDGSMNNGFLTCEDESTTSSGIITIERTWQIITNCQDTTYCDQIITIEAGSLQEDENAYNQKYGLSVYPSPTSGILNITAPWDAQVGDELYLRDISGAIILQANYSVSESFWIDMTTLKMGTYILTWRSNNQSYVKRVLKY